RRRRHVDRGQRCAGEPGVFRQRERKGDVNLTVSPAALRLAHARSVLLEASALIFDVDGTLAETEEVHRQAFNDAFVKAGIDWHWGRTIYKELLQVAGGKERIRAFDWMRRGPLSLSDGEIAELHRIKTGRYVE